MTPTLSQIIMGFVGVAVTFLGVVLAQIGKRGDQQIQQNKDQFGRLLDEANYWHEQAERSRAEFEGRWDRQMARCRKITDQAYITITNLMRGAAPEDQQAGTKTLAEIDHHRQDENPDAP